jgi:hypothetical protein
MLPVLLLPALALALSGGAPPAAAQGTSSISGVVFHDLDGNGVHDSGEPGMAGWLVKLEPYNTDESLLKEMKTDRDGRYSFGDLPAGDYDIALPCDGQPSLWGGTSNEYTALGVTLEAGADFEDLDFPVVPLRAPPSQPHNGSIEGRIAWDEDRDAVAEPGEPGIAGLEVMADMENQPVCFLEDVPPVYSGPDGRFRFSGLIPGTYLVNPLFPDEPTFNRWVIDAPGVTTTEGGYDWFESSLQVEVPDRGTGNIAIGVILVQGTGSISGSLYTDKNENGVRDPDDPLGASGCLMGVFYRTPGGYSRFPFSINPCPHEGRYTFSGLGAGDYMVGVALGPGRPVNPPPLLYDMPNFPLTLGDGEQRTGVDFGFAFQPGEPTPEIVPTAEPTPIVLTPAPEPAAPLSTLPPVGPPTTGSGAAPSDGSLAGLAAALAVAGALAVGASALPARRRTRFRR